MTTAEHGASCLCVDCRSRRAAAPAPQPGRPAELVDALEDQPAQEAKGFRKVLIGIGLVAFVVVAQGGLWFLTGSVGRGSLVWGAVLAITGLCAVAVGVREMRRPGHPLT